MSQAFPILISVALEDAGKRLDQFLTARLEAVSRAHVQQLISQQQVLVNGEATKASLKLRGGEKLSVLGTPSALRSELSPRKSLSILFTRMTISPSSTSPPE
jgi:23S rRNA-/tRNA-specific pseudouridylate synthase